MIGLKLLAVSFAMATTASATGVSFLKSNAKHYASNTSLMADTSSKTKTDITTSSAVHDCFLLFKGADATWEGFNPFADCLSYPLRFDWFSYVTGRPYKSDLYTYWYFNDSNKYGYSFDKDAKYALSLLATKGDSAGNVVWDNNGATYGLEMVGEPYHVGNQWLLKFVAKDIFPDPKVGESFGYQLMEFGKEAEGGGISTDWSYSIDEKQLFSYDDDQYDITSKIWGDKTKIVSITKSDAFPLIMQKEVGNHPSDTSNWEMHGLYFDLDRSPDYIKHIDVEYQMVEYYVNALHDWWDIQMGAGGGGTDHEIIKSGTLRVPDSPRYVPGNEIEKEYEGTEFATRIYPVHKDIFADDVIDLTQSKRNFFGGWFGIPEKTTYITHTQSIIEIGKTMLENENMSKWISQNCVKDDGSNYQYAVFYDLTSEEWTGKVHETIKKPFPVEYYQLVRCHVSQGVYITKMTVMEGLEELQWNAFMQPVNEKPGVIIENHEFTISEMLIAWGKANKPWFQKLAIVGYSVICVALIGLITYQTLIGGNPYNDSKGSDKRTKKGKR